MRAYTMLLGLIAFFAAAGPAFAQYIPPKQMTLSPTGVDLSGKGGRFVFQVTDLTIGPFVLERSHRGGQQKNPSKYFGNSWTHNYDIYVMEGSGQHAEDTYIAIGRQTVTFTKTSYRTFFPMAPDSMGSTLQLVNNAFVYVNRDGDVYTFNSNVQAQPPNPTNPASQRIASIVYANGHRLDFTYAAGTSRLTRIESSLGYALVFEYDANGFVSKACGFNRTIALAGTACAGALAMVNYTYANFLAGSETVPLLVSVLDVLGQTWGYDYIMAGPIKLSCVRQVNSSACRLQNSFDAAFQQTAADGGTWQYYFSGNDPDYIQLPGMPPEPTSVEFNGPEGLHVGAGFGGGLLNDYVQNGRSTHLEWNGIFLEKLYHPEGNWVQYNADANYNPAGESWTPKAGSGTTGVGNLVAYGPNGDGNPDCVSISRKVCNKPVYRLDYRGSRTDYAWDPNSGSVLTETGPADAAGIRPVKRAAYVQRYAWISNGTGGYVQAASPVWLPASEKICRTTATSGDACAGGPSDEVVTAYDYGPDAGPNNLLMRGKTVTADGATLRECYGYDASGNRVWTTGAGAGLSTCPAS
jgi:hypothetical protein